MDQWQAKAPERRIVMMFSIQARDAVWAESVIHAYLHHKRMYRYWQPDTQTFHSISVRTGKVVPDGYEVKGFKKTARGKQVEWFYHPIDEIVDLVQNVCK